MNDILITHVHWHTTCPVYEQAQQHLLRKLTICAHTTAVQHAPSAAVHLQVCGTSTDAQTGDEM